jgi:molecular chaperone DnaJ
MEVRDLYAVLGVDPGASQRDIKRIFIKLQRRCHPEVNPGDEEAEIRYSSICMAFSVLGDSRRRAEYDRLGHEEFFNSHPQVEEYPDSGEVHDLAEGFPSEGLLGEILGLKKPEEARLRSRGEDIRHFLSLDFSKAVVGGVTRITVSRRVTCTRCRGSGAASSGGLARCPVCRGEGVRPIRFGSLTVQEECRRCDGKGSLLLEVCPACEGSGQEGRTEEVEVRIPPGVTGGSQIRIEGFGHEGPGGGSPGDLLVITRVDDQQGLERKGDNIYSTVPVMVWEAALGANILVQTVDGKVNLTIPPGIQGGQRLRLAGRGVPNLKTGRRGDHFVEVKVMCPPPGNEDEKRAYQRLAELFPGNPRIRGGF